MMVLGENIMSFVSENDTHRSNMVVMLVGEKRSSSSAGSIALWMSLEGAVLMGLHTFSSTALHRIDDVGDVSIVLTATGDTKRPLCTAVTLVVEETSSSSSNSSEGLSGPVIASSSENSVSMGSSSGASPALISLPRILDPSSPEEISFPVILDSSVNEDSPSASTMVALVSSSNKEPSSVVHSSSEELSFPSILESSVKDGSTSSPRMLTLVSSSKNESSSVVKRDSPSVVLSDRYPSSLSASSKAGAW
mmetsp:Transcript_23365/g.35526  ORF Transcript_23365/g.35526 Transcript_23365/m.35526 type:complete len:250 (+) Transcript_23365:876-1625(+)